MVDKSLHPTDKAECEDKKVEKGRTTSTSSNKSSLAGILAKIPGQHAVVRNAEKRLPTAAASEPPSKKGKDGETRVQGTIVYDLVQTQFYKYASSESEPDDAAWCESVDKLIADEADEATEVAPERQPQVQVSRLRITGKRPPAPRDEEWQPQKVPKPG